METKENNSSDQDYTGIVVVSDSDGVATAREISVNQKYEPIMQQFASTTFPATGGDIYFTVHTDYDVVFRSVPNYITISCDGTVYNEGQRISASEASNKTFVLTAAENTGDTRTVQNTFNMGHYIGNELQNRVRYFNFTQEAAEPEPTVGFEIPLYIEWNIPNGKTATYEVRVSLMENGNEHISASHSDTVTWDSTQDNTYEGRLQFNPTTEFDAVKITTTCSDDTDPESQIRVTVKYDQCGNDNPGEYNIINSGEAYELICDSFNSGNIDETKVVYVTIDLK